MIRYHSGSVLSRNPLAGFQLFHITKSVPIRNIMAEQNFLVTQRANDFAKWLFNHTGQFPKSHRFSVAVRLENAIIEFIEHTTVANMRQNKLPLLKNADEALTRLRVLFRFSYEMRFINFKSYEFGSQKLVELGKLLGGWIKNPGKKQK